MSVAAVVFARAPVPGAAKTRLVPALGEVGAARLHERLVRRTLDTTCAAFPGRVELCCAPDAAHPFFAACAAENGAALTEQGAGDLGTRMHRALARALCDADAAVLVGTDCPALAPEHLRDAAAALAAGADVVLGPASDGGYVLVGARRVDAALFEGIRWGTDAVLGETRERIRALGWRHVELGTLWDVDRPDDLQRLRRELADGARLLAGLAA
jgi:rSAM/selenodomain-associated transferase 1